MAKVHASSSDIFGRSVGASATLWKYFSYAKFCSFLNRSALHCTRVDQFSDHFEGNWPASDIEYWENPQNGGSAEQLQLLRKHSVACCWVESSNESAAMWPLYGGGAESVAITTTFGALDNVLVAQSASAEKEAWVCGGVAYIDFLRDSIMAAPRDDGYRQRVFKVLAVKHASYNYENEVRILGIRNFPEFPEAGIDLVVDPRLIIERVVVNPLAQDWFFDLVSATCRERGLNQVVHSELRRLN